MEPCRLWPGRLWVDSQILQHSNALWKSSAQPVILQLQRIQFPDCFQVLWQASFQLIMGSIAAEPCQDTHVSENDNRMQS